MLSLKLITLYSQRADPIIALIAGAVRATLSQWLTCICFCCRFVANKYFLVSPKSGDQVEWGYCFDVHLNAFFPLLVILHGIGAVLYGELYFTAAVSSTTGTIYSRPSFATRSSNPSLIYYIIVIRRTCIADSVMLTTAVLLYFVVVLGAHGIILTLIGNTLLFVSFSYYVYITFLGYDSKCVSSLW